MTDTLLPSSASGGYAEFLRSKSQEGVERGFAPLWIPDFLFDFQRVLVEWAVRKGRGALFTDTGTGKTAMQLVWAENVVRKTGGRVLILTPIAVGIQTVAEGQRFGIDCFRSRDGRLDGARIVVSNYEQLHKFDPASFAGVVCDESSVLKSFAGPTQKAVTRALLKVPYRLLCSATPAPNDHTELGTASEALGELGYSDMLSRFFRQADRKPHRLDDVVHQPEYYAKLAFRVSQQIGQWRLKGHAVEPFWRWVRSWARVCRRPSDLGFSDDGFILPPLVEREHVVKSVHPPAGMLFALPAFGLHEEREERRRTLRERCECVRRLIEGARSALVWCHLNAEGDLLEKLIPGAVQVAGADSDDEKEERILAFLDGRARVLITKPKIAGYGLNFQHCAHVVTFATHSWEQHYQAVRRCWRYGQTAPVTVDTVSTEAEHRVRANLARKSQAADEMFSWLMRRVSGVAQSGAEGTSEEAEVPAWLSTIRL